RGPLFEFPQLRGGHGHRQFTPVNAPFQMKTPGLISEASLL
ncbi:hypothetical protein Pgy4_39630, partial [Pseudomonas savastanoi pv. glycinea str. race 4]